MGLEKKILHLCLIDDDPLMHVLVKKKVPESWTVHSYFAPEQINWLGFYDAFLIDFHLSGTDQNDGIEITRRAKAEFPQALIANISGDLSLEGMELGLKSGASRFIAKPLDEKELLDFLRVVENFVYLKEQESSHHRYRLIGNSPQILRLKETISQFAVAKGPVYLEGETGTGKEVVAHLIHQLSSRGPFLSLNCGAIPENLFEAELFGFEKGAFTDAKHSKPGLAEVAHGGTLFLDEIQLLTAPLQAKLLRFLDLGEARRIGGSQSYNSKCRVIVASNRSLSEMVQNGEFRADLYHRLQFGRIFLPPLRERISDIRPLIEFFLKEMESPKRFLDSTIEFLEKYYQFPGNVRELKKLVEYTNWVTPLPYVRVNELEGLLLPEGLNFSDESDLLLNEILESAHGPSRAPRDVRGQANDSKKKQESYDEDPSKFKVFNFSLNFDDIENLQFKEIKEKFETELLKWLSRFPYEKAVLYKKLQISKSYFYKRLAKSKS